MRFSGKNIGTILAAVAFLAVCGCGGGDEASEGDPSASINGGSGSGSTGSGSTAANLPELDPLHPVIEMQTSMGTVKVQLDTQQAPLTVENFLLYIAKREFDQTIFHEVTRDEPKVIIGGAYQADHSERPFHGAIRNEAENELKNERGTIAMARLGDPDSATRHFFFNLTDNEQLDFVEETSEGYGYCVFGKVIEGLDVLDKISAVKTHDTNEFASTPVVAVLLKKAIRIR